MTFRRGRHAQAGGTPHADDFMVTRIEEHNGPTRLLARLVHDSGDVPGNSILHGSLHAEFHVFFRWAESLSGSILDPTLHEHLVEAAASRNRLEKERGVVRIQRDPQHATVDTRRFAVNG